MSNSRMVEAVNRLIGNLLSGSGEVFLPDVGSLYAEQQGAKRVDKHTILPPCRVVSFTSQERGVSLVEEIARAAGVEVEKAEEIYQTWLARTRSENGLLIEEVGELKFKNFVLAPEFDKILNPAGHAPLKISTKRGFDWVLWLGVAAILIAGGLLGYQFLWNPMMPGGDLRASKPEAEVVAEIPISADTLVTADFLVVEEGAGAAAHTQDSTSKPSAAQPAVPNTSGPKQAANPTAVQTAASDVLTTVAGRYYAVLGVFSTRENAERAVLEALKKNPQWQCRIYRLGAKFMVSPFEGDAETSAQFVAENKESNPGMWPYKAR